MNTKPEPSRKPPVGTIRTLRHEVGFRCPVVIDDRVCGSPYLTWHHFDPPWRVEHHHRADGMIALCQEHHQKADAGAFTLAQLRDMKESGLTRSEAVSGRFDWMRRDYLSIVGGNAFLETDVLLELSGVPAIWFSRNEREEKMLNFDLGSLRKGVRVAIRDNFWTVPPDDVDDLVCPPSGKEIMVSFADGNKFRIRFDEIHARAQLTKKHYWLRRWAGEFTYPLTMVEVWERRGEAGLHLAPDSTVFQNRNSIAQSLFRGGPVAISLELPIVNPFLRAQKEFTNLYGPEGYKPK